LFVLQLPDLKDAEAVQKFFLEEIQLGEELLAQGNASSHRHRLHLQFDCRPRAFSLVLSELKSLPWGRGFL